MKIKEYIQHNSTHPGELLAEFYLEPLGLTITEAADKLKISRPNLSSILNKRAGTSPLMALKLSKAFNTTPHYWLNLQLNYDLWHVIQKIKVLRAKSKFSHNMLIVVRAI